jgi:hypothetical protein
MRNIPSAPYRSGSYRLSSSWSSARLYGLRRKPSMPLFWVSSVHSERALPLMAKIGTLRESLLVASSCLISHVAESLLSTSL